VKKGGVQASDQGSILYPREVHSVTQKTEGGFIMKKFTAWALCIALILTLVQAPVQAAAPDNPSKHAFDNKIIKRIQVDNIYRHIHHLSEVIGPRVAGTDAELQTVEYLVEEFK
jgi:aminopeptidase YwaD